MSTELSFDLDTPDVITVRHTKSYEGVFSSDDGSEYSYTFEVEQKSNPDLDDPLSERPYCLTMLDLAEIPTNTEQEKIRTAVEECLRQNKIIVPADGYSIYY